MPVSSPPSVVFLKKISKNQNFKAGGLPVTQYDCHMVAALYQVNMFKGNIKPHIFMCVRIRMDYISNCCTFF